MTTHPPRSSPRRDALVAAALRWAAFALAVALVCVGGAWLARAQTPVERTATIIVVPHPDDEFQDWSLIEQTPDQYKVFVSLTLGEETGFCDPEVLAAALQPELEPAPTPLPTGRFTESCEQARTSSLLDFLSGMSAHDDTIPGSFGAPHTSPALPIEGTDLCRSDEGVADCGDALRTARTWVDAEDRGAVVFFDLGDGDLSAAEAGWAIRSVIDQRAALGLDDDLRIGAIIGAFANLDTPCFSYPHPDHLAVHDALWRTDFGVGPQLAATCLLDPRQSLTALVSAEGTRDAFELADDGTRVGAHTTAYGWLHASTYPVSQWTQLTLFMRMQSFWVRGND